MMKSILAFLLCVPAVRAQCTLTGVSITFGAPNTITYTSASGSGCGALANGVTSANPIPVNSIVTGQDGSRGVQGAGAQVDASGNVLAGVASGKTGSLEMTGSTSGQISGFTVLDALGSTVLYILPNGPGATGQVLSDAGAAACPNLAAGAPTVCHQLAWVNAGTVAGTSGALVLVEEHTAASSASLPFTTCLSGTYDTYQIEFNGILPSTNLANILLRFSTNGGTTYDSANNYSWVAARQSVGGSANQVGSAATSGFVLDANGGVTSVTGVGSFSSTVKLYLNSGYPRINATSGAWDNTVNPDIWSIETGSYKVASPAVNAFQIVPSTGNLAAGNVRCYGIAK